MHKDSWGAVSGPSCLAGPIWPGQVGPGQFPLASPRVRSELCMDQDASPVCARYGPLCARSTRQPYWITKGHYISLSGGPSCMERNTVWPQSVLIRLPGLESHLSRPGRSTNKRASGQGVIGFEHFLGIMGFRLFFHVSQTAFIDV